MNVFPGEYEQTLLKDYCTTKTKWLLHKNFQINDGITGFCILEYPLPLNNCIWYPLSLQHHDPQAA